LILPSIVDLVSICAKKGIQHAILSPGSRCAPITLAFARHPQIQCRTISDERSAAFIAMGMAQQLDTPVVLVCTSGSAAYNYAPAIAEAYFQQIPLIIITADRPTEWIDQWDGQTIRQSNIYGNHVKESFDFPDDSSHIDKLWHAHRITNEAINLANQLPAGPVHINIPLREPFYPEQGESFEYKDLKTIEIFKSASTLASNQKIQLKEKLSTFKRIIIVPGQQKPDADLQKTIDDLIVQKKAVVITDTLSNLQSSNTISFHDHYLGRVELNDSLTPDLIISFGKSIISKSLKIFLRSSFAEHWHIQPAGYVPDTYQSLTSIINCEPLDFIDFLHQEIQCDTGYFERWKKIDQTVGEQLFESINQAEFGEFKALFRSLLKMPNTCKLHVANSMSVRYLNFLGPRPQEVICNRGTSGIDGSNSTAVGCAFTTKEMVTLITGDLAFFYDRNAFWNNYSMHNLRIILLNNHAGGIFRFIEGPSKQAELEEFFETHQGLTAENLAKDFGFEYQLATDEISLEKALQHFYESSVMPKIIEVKSESKNNVEIFRKIRASIKIF
jgi:2-succinyl-5-enolpyruvyl-6-hydroxy-3-cyclohexene-1-carboxylate synthase